MPDVVSEKSVLPAGGGAYTLPSLTLGIFLNDQPTHRISHGSSIAKHWPLSKHQGWLLPAGSEGYCEYDDDLEFATVSLNERLLEEFGFHDSAGFQAVVGDIDPLLVNLCLNADTFAQSGTLYRETMHRALAAQVVQMLKPAPPWHAGIEDHRLRKVLDYIHDNLGADLTLATMADLAAMSGTHFSKAFKKEVGLSPLQYVIAARLDLASVLLRTTQLSVAEVAWRAGYRDLSRFALHFKRKFNATPAAFRSS
ncbi:AraC family transcriptional regulator [Roseibium sp. HPY-6]|uniref:AraC family transcriptional regulator n=1 Tax=Roseibium sp. HPY-6 TaxID=3229852 RepID=UPI00338E6A3D